MTWGYVSASAGRSWTCVKLFAVGASRRESGFDTGGLSLLAADTFPPPSKPPGKGEEQSIRGGVRHKRIILPARPNIISHRDSRPLVLTGQPVVAREARRHPRPAGHAARVPDVSDDEAAGSPVEEDEQSRRAARVSLLPTPPSRKPTGASCRGVQENSALSATTDTLCSDRKNNDRFFP